jgi:hypothetical protein
MVEIKADFHFCAICDVKPRIELMEIVQVKGAGFAKVAPEDLEGADWGTDDQSFRLRASLDPGGGRRRYLVIYRITDHSGRVDFVRWRVDVNPSPPYTWPPPFWAKF